MGAMKLLTGCRSILHRLVVLSWATFYHMVDALIAALYHDGKTKSTTIPIASTES